MKLFCGVGINDADYVVRKYEQLGYENGKRKQKLLWMCPYAQKWESMLKRCYSDKYQIRYPSYINCYVCDEWLTFSNFRSWMEQQDWEGKHLDKDLLVKGNKVYSPETCCFLPSNINKFMIEHKTSRGKWPIGVYWNKRDQIFKAQCQNPITGKNEQLGIFTCPEEAHTAWVNRKLEIAKIMVKDLTDSRIAEAVLNRYINYAQV